MLSMSGNVQKSSVFSRYVCDFFFSPPPIAFEELERALGVAQRAEEARKQLQVQLEEQVKEIERASEQERKSLQQELTRVKQEVVTIMKVRKGLLLNICLLIE